MCKNGFVGNIELKRVIIRQFNWVLNRLKNDGVSVAHWEIFVESNLSKWRVKNHSGGWYLKVKTNFEWNLRISISLANLSPMSRASVGFFILSKFCTSSGQAIRSWKSKTIWKSILILKLFKTLAHSSRLAYLRKKLIEQVPYTKKIKIK